MTDFILAVAAQFDAEPHLADHEFDALPSSLGGMEDAVDGLICARCPLPAEQHPGKPACTCVDHDTLGCYQHDPEGYQWMLDHPDGISAEEDEMMAQYAYESSREEGCNTMNNDVMRELIEAAEPFADAEPKIDWPCHGGDPVLWEICGNCNRIKRLRAAIAAAEGQIA